MNFWNKASYIHIYVTVIIIFIREEIIALSYSPKNLRLHHFLFWFIFLQFAQFSRDDSQ